MSYSNNINVLIADNDDESREMMAGILTMHGYNVLQAIDGGTGIKVVEEDTVDVAIIGYQMTPKTGLEFASHILVKGYDIGMIMVTDNPSTDLLLEAGKFEIKQVMRKPVDPDKLVETVRRILRAYGKNPDAVAGNDDPTFTKDELMRRALALADQNAKSKMGGPFGAVVADENGQILGEGVNGVSTRHDPTAHAEVMAIRRATERLGKTDLSGCVVYSSSEPTMLGQALIISTGISKVYYGLTHADVGATRLNEEGIIGEIQKPIQDRSVPYEQLQRDDAQSMFAAWSAQKQKLSD